MGKAKKATIILLILVFIGFGYSQYASASQISAEITHSELIGRDGDRSDHSIRVQFNNPSLLYLTAGETEFTIAANGETIGHGMLAPFVLPSLSTSDSQGTFEMFGQLELEEISAVKISGVTRYDLVFTSIDVPFVFYPTQQQAREFIHQD